MDGREAADYVASLSDAEFAEFLRTARSDLAKKRNQRAADYVASLSDAEFDRFVAAREPWTPAGKLPGARERLAPDPGGTRFGRAGRAEAARRFGGAR